MEGDGMKEVLKLALDALEDLGMKHYENTGEVLYKETFTAIKAALAQPAQEPDHGDELTIAYMSGVHRGKELAAQPAQEPVAWLDEEKKIIYWHNTHETDDYHGFRRTTPLYTTPQQRPWVGLTEEEVDTIYQRNGTPKGFAKAIEAKLKDKNSG